MFYDIDLNKLNSLKKDNYQIADNIVDAVAKCDCSFICVPTPSADNGEIILDYISNASKECGKALKRKNEKHIFIVKSTVLPGTTENKIIPLIEENSDKIFDVDFGVIYNPEFITEIHATWTNDEEFQISPSNESRAMLGESKNKEWGGFLIKNLYRGLGFHIIRTDYKTAEMIKYASNCILATKISYWNEIYLICQKLGIDSKKVAEAVTLDPRIGKYGSVHGKGFGGKCLPKDIKAYISFAKKYADIKILKAVDEVNELMRNNYGVRE